MTRNTVYLANMAIPAALCVLCELPWMIPPACGRALQEALAEARRFGMRDRRGDLTEHLIRYYKERLPLSIRLGQGNDAD